MSPSPAGIALAALMLIASAMPRDAHSFPACIAKCDLKQKSLTNCCTLHPQLVSACGDYNTCRQDAADEFAGCVASRNGACAPTDAGRCTLKVERCVGNCQATYSLELRACENTLKTDASDALVCGEGMIHGRRDLRAVARACQSCGVFTRPALPFAPPPSNCQEACIARIPSIASCNDNCRERCEGNRFALSICLKACRNLACPSAKQRCTKDGPLIDPKFRRCCVGSCPVDVEDCG